MNWSLNLGRIAGIRLFIHWTFWILIAYIFFAHYAAGHGLREALWGSAFIFALFGCVLLHELGHALTAKRFGILTDYITLLPIGGLANMRKMPDRPSQELLVALAGPAVNFVIAAILFVYLTSNDTMPGLDSLHTHQVSPENFWFNLFVVNVVLAVFNLIPAFPMDGGRVLRALLAYRLRAVVATRIAAKVGQILAILFVLIGIFVNVWLVFIGLFVYLGAASEASHEYARSVLVRYTANDAAIRRFKILSADAPLEAAVRLLLEGQDKKFLVQEKERITGVLTRDDMIRGLTEFGPSRALGDIANRDFRTLGPDTNLQDAADEIAASETNIALIYENSQLIGILDSENVSEFLMIHSAEGV